MTKLLNRIALLVSLCFGFIIAFVYIGINSYRFGGDDVFFSALLGLFLGLIIKKVFLSKQFIIDRLEFFAEQLQNNQTSINNNISIKKEYKTETIEEQNNDDFEEKNNNLNENVLNNISIETKKIEKKEIPKTPSKILLAIKSFFSENLLAKLGGILVFLGVLFLLSLVYNKIGDIGKLIIGFAIGFAIFITGIILDRKKLPKEARILLGIGILINYLVILGVKYLTGDIIDNNILTTGTTFLLLILNTVFAVVTAIVYKSRVLLLFSFLFAFINPLLIGGNLDNYTVVGYSLIIALGGLYLGVKQKDIILAVGVFILANLLFLIAPFTSDIEWIIKLIGTTIVSILSIYSIYKIDIKQLSGVFLGSYIFIILLLGSGENYIMETTSFISYMISIVLFFGLGIYYFLKTSVNAIIYLLIFPILILLGLGFEGVLFSIPLSLSIIILVYLFGFSLIKTKISNIFKYLFFIILGSYIFLNNSLFTFSNINLDLYSFISVVIVSFIFIFSSYYLSTKKDLGFLYSIGTIGGIFTLAPIIINNNTSIILFYISIISIIIFSVSNWILPFINNNLLKNPKNINIANLLAGIITGLLFIAYQLFDFGNIYFSGITLGYSFVGLAIIYFIMGYFIIDKLGIEKVKFDENSKNIIYTYLGASISVFSLAIALIFSEYEYIISTIWLFQATLMFYFFYKTKENKIFIAAILLFIIGLVKFFSLIDIVNEKDFIFLIPFTIIFISYILNIKFVNDIKKGQKRIIHDILHILAIIFLSIVLAIIIPYTGHGWSTIGVAIFISILNLIYAYFNSKILKIFFIIIFSGALLAQIGKLDNILYTIDKQQVGYFRGLQYLSTLVFGYSLYIWNKINKENFLNKYINISFSIYLLIITSYYIYDIFNNTFAITIYWGLASSIILYYGISKNIIKFRTIGLYFISLTAGKIFLYDIWFGMDGAISRVIAFIGIGLVFIFISTSYTKKYGNDIAGEFNFKNLK